MPSDKELVEFASKQDKQMGGYLSILLKFGVVGIAKEWDYTKLVNHLETNKEFNLITGFEYNRRKGLIWLDSIAPNLKKLFKHSYAKQF